MLSDATDERDGVLVDGRLGQGDPFVERVTEREAADLALEEDVECPLAGLGPGSHQELTRPR